MTLLQRSSLDFDQEAWDRLAYFALRPELFFDSWATVKPTNQSTPGSVVTFSFVGELAPATTPLTETVDVTPVVYGDSKLSVTLNEYGNVVKDTRFLHATSYIPLNPVTANVLGYNAGVSIDTIVSNVLHGGTNVRYSGGGAARTDVIGTDELTARDIRVTVAELRNANVPTFDGLYLSSINPDVAVDLREETGAAAWRDPHVYSKPEEIWRNEIGAFEGTRFIETPRAVQFADAGGGGVGTKADVYATLIVGQQFLAKAVPVVAGFGPQPRIVPGPVTDNLRRFVPMGWYHLVGYGRFREEALRRIESGSSLDEDYAA